MIHIISKNNYIHPYTQLKHILSLKIAEQIIRASQSSEYCTEMCDTCEDASEIICLCRKLCAVRDEAFIL